jgi:hypothetical protein
MVAAVARTASGEIDRARRSVGGLLDRLQLALRRIEASTDPLGAQWAEEMRIAAKDPAFTERVVAQPAPQDIIDDWYQSQPA